MIASAGASRWGDVVLAAGGLRQPSIGRVLVFACYLDDSGHDQPMVTMGGYVAHLDAWRRFEERSEELLNRYEVPIFHAKEFQSTKPPFNGWSRLKKRSFTVEWFDIAKAHVDMGISISMHRGNYKAQQKELGLNQTMSAYGTCFSGIVVSLTRDPILSPFIEREGISFLVESGNVNNSELQNWYHKVSKFPAFKGALRGISFVPKDHSRAIQIADFYAYYARRHAVEVARAQWKRMETQDWFHRAMRLRIRHYEVQAKRPYADGPQPVGKFEDVVFPFSAS